MSSQWTTVHVDGSQMWSYMSVPDHAGPHPGVVVIQHAPGVDEVIQVLTRRLAMAGYVAIAPALYHREDPDNDPGGRRGRLKDANIIADVNATIDLLRRHPAVRPDRIGITGFCMGGRVTYLAATACPGLAAASVYYGGSILGTWGAGPSPLDRSAGIQCPIMGNFGDQDQNPTPADVATIEAELTRLGKTYDFKMYAGAGHGFNCDERDSWHEASARDAWTRTLSWFQKYLAPVAASA
jgi:carboxymethylenebutenolidase